MLRHCTLKSKNYCECAGFYILLIRIQQLLVFSVSRAGFAGRKVRKALSKHLLISEIFLIYFPPGSLECLQNVVQQNSHFNAVEMKRLLLECNDLYIMLLLIFDQSSYLNSLNA